MPKITPFISSYRIWFKTDTIWFSDDERVYIENIKHLVEKVQNILLINPIWSHPIKSFFKYNKILSCFVKVNDLIFIKIK